MFMGFVFGFIVGACVVASSAVASAKVRSLIDKARAWLASEPPQ